MASILKAKRVFQNPLLFVVSFTANIVYPTFLYFTHPENDLGFGNPKALYFYDIDSSCSKYDPNIVSALGHLSKRTGVKFIRLPNPIAEVSGGISYYCGETTNYGKLGESEAGYESNNIIFIILWNKISLYATDGETIIHETLHSMGFGHSQNPRSIMHPHHRGTMYIESDLIDFIRKMYVHNPLAYLAIIPLNPFYVIWFIFIFGGLLYSVLKQIKTQRRS